MPLTALREGSSLPLPSRMWYSFSCLHRPVLHENDTTAAYGLWRARASSQRHIKSLAAQHPLWPCSSRSPYSSSPSATCFPRPSPALTPLDRVERPRARPPAPSSERSDSPSDSPDQPDSLALRSPGCSDDRGLSAPQDCSDAHMTLVLIAARRRVLGNDLWLIAAVALARSPLQQEQQPLRTASTLHASWRAARSPSERLQTHMFQLAEQSPEPKVAIAPSL